MAVLHDGQIYDSDDFIHDLGSFQCIGRNGFKRYYKGLSADIDKLPKYDNLGTGSLAKCMDTGDIYQYFSFEKEWIKQERKADLPEGGKKGQLLAKKTDEDGDAEWIDANFSGENNAAIVAGDLISDAEDIPVGHVISYLGTVAPTHYLICDGREYSIADYPYLVNHIKDNYGVVNYFGGDGLLTFCVPDLKEKFLKGSETSGIYEEAGLPNITADWKSEPSASANGAVYITSEKGTLDAVSGGGSSDNRIHFDASLINPIYGKSETVTPSNISVLFCIKFEPTYSITVRRETTEEDILLLEETVELLTRENTFLQNEINSLEAIMEAINRRQAEKEAEENGDGDL